MKTETIQEMCDELRARCSRLSQEERDRLEEMAMKRIYHKGPVVVPDWWDSFRANRAFGEDYGVDWIYAGMERPPVYTNL